MSLSAAVGVGGGGGGGGIGRTAVGRNGEFSWFIPRTKLLFMTNGVGGIDTTNVGVV